MPKKDEAAVNKEAEDNAATEKAARAKAKEGRPVFVPKIKRNLTLPLIKAAIDEPLYIKFNEPVKIGKEIGDKDAAITAVVTDLETGEVKQYLVPAVFQGVLHDEYGCPHYGAPEKGKPVQELEPTREGQEPHNYVGRAFQVIRHTKPSGKNYHPMTILEIEAE